MDVREARFDVLEGDALERLRGIPSGSFDSVVTSPPYWRQRDYGSSGQIGWEGTPARYAARVAAVLVEAARTLRPHGLMWVVLDDKRKADGALANTDARLVLALEAAGVEKRHEVTWVKVSTKPNGSDYLPSHAFEKILVFRPKGADPLPYWDPLRAVQESAKGDDRRLTDVWTIPVGTEKSEGGHEAMFPTALARRCLEVSTSARGYCSMCRAPWARRIERRESDPGVRRGNGARGHDRSIRPMRSRGWAPTCDCGPLGTPVLGVVLDPFCGSGRTGVASLDLGLRFVGIDVNPDNVKLSARNLSAALPKLEGACS